MIWNEKEFNDKVGEVAERLSIRKYEAQLLLAQERFLARLVTIPEGKSFVWKGGSLLLRRYRLDDISRFTVDIDLLAKGVNVESSEKIFETATAIDLQDGFNFYDITKSFMIRDTPYGGERFEIKWMFFKKVNPMLLKIDVCAGDDVDVEIALDKDIFLAAKDVEPLSFQVYPAEFIFAEKLETIVRFKTGNTRFKDFIDLWSLSQKLSVSNKLKQAIERCFNRRETQFNKDIILNILTDGDFCEQLNKYGKKHYQKINLPDTKVILDSIKIIVEKL